MAGIPLNVILLLFLGWLVIPLFVAISYLYGLYVASIVYLIMLSYLSVLVYQKMSKWYKRVKPKLGTIGCSLLAANMVCILVIFAYFFLLLLSFVVPIPIVRYFPYGGWWGYPLILGSWILLVLIDIGLLLCSSIALWIYLERKDNRLKQQQKVVNNSSKISSL